MAKVIKARVVFVRLELNDYKEVDCEFKDGKLYVEGVFEEPTPQEKKHCKKVVRAARRVLQAASSPTARLRSASTGRSR